MQRYMVKLITPVSIFGMLTLAALPANAASLGVSTITAIRVGAGGTNAINIKGTFGSCRQPQISLAEVGEPKYQALLTLLLAAYLSGRTVELWDSGGSNCGSVDVVEIRD